MRRGTWITLAVLGLMVAGILAALVREAGRGPVFRAGDHADYQACLAAIPAEWGPGSLDRTGAEEACFYVHRRTPD